MASKKCSALRNCPKRHYVKVLQRAGVDGVAFISMCLVTGFVRVQALHDDTLARHFCPHRKLFVFAAPHLQVCLVSVTSQMSTEILIEWPALSRTWCHSCTLSYPCAVCLPAAVKGREDSARATICISCGCKSRCDTPQAGTAVAVRMATLRASKTRVKRRRNPASRTHILASTTCDSRLTRLERHGRGGSVPPLRIKARPPPTRGTHLLIKFVECDNPLTVAKGGSRLHCAVLGCVATPACARRVMACRCKCEIPVRGCAAKAGSDKGRWNKKTPSPQALSVHIMVALSRGVVVSCESDYSPEYADDASDLCID